MAAPQYSFKRYLNKKEDSEVRKKNLMQKKGKNYFEFYIVLSMIL